MLKSTILYLLVFCFVIGATAQTWVPENPIGSVAIIGGKATLEESVGDVALKDKLLDLGYGVGYFDDTEISTGAVTREQVEIYDLIIASESASSSRLRHLLRWDFSTPTINMEPTSVQNNHHKLELIYSVATGNGWMLKTDENANKIKILDGEHPLAAGFSSDQVLDAITNPEEYVAAYPFSEGIIGYMVDDIGVIPIASFNSVKGDTALVICGIKVGTLQVDSIAFNARYVQFNLHSNTIPTWTESTDKLFEAAINWVLEPSTKVEINPNKTPVMFELAQNYPNPFNPSTTIEFNLKKRQKIQIKVYDVLGKEITTLADGEFNSGNHQLVWNGQNSAGENMPGGIYLYSLTSLTEKVVRKMTLIK